jgi:hypothetical protein
LNNAQFDQCACHPHTMLGEEFLNLGRTLPPSCSSSYLALAITPSS